MKNIIEKWESKYENYLKIIELTEDLNNLYGIEFVQEMESQLIECISRKIYEDILQKLNERLQFNTKI